MKSLITAALFTLGASAAVAAPGNLQPGNADANLRSLLEQLGGGSDTSTSDLSELLTCWDSLMRVLRISRRW